jgi:uncharacterized repeat protein (TIGR01451 family)
MYGTNPFNPPEPPVVENRADLVMTSAVSPEPAQVLGTLIYTFTVVNRGPVTATLVRFVDKLPAELGFVSAASTQGSCSSERGTVDCSLGSLTTTGRIVVTVRATINSPPAGGTVENTASVTAAEVDPDISSNTSTAATTVVSRATRLEVAGIANPSSAGTASTVTVTGRDAAGAVATDYVGTVRFTSTDPAASLPAVYTFTAAERGVHVFTFGVTLRTPGSQTVTVSDQAAPSIAGSQTVQVNAAGATGSLLVTAASASWSAGAANSMTVTVRDAAGSVATSYRGTVRFSSTDAKSLLPADYTFTDADAGIRTFAGVVLRTAGSQSVTATDAATPALTGSRTVTVTPGDPSVFRITGLPATVAAGAAATITVTAVDVWENVATGYRGTAIFTSSDPAASLPANYLFTAADAGVHTFTGGLVFKTLGEQSVTVRDATILFLAATARTQVTASQAPASKTR